ncbi:glycosyltransferase family 2 protein [Pseudomonas pergaminensis]|uniref:Glycosyltransferase family 2 protein n=1 Tax=Pseudomonas pergaminensis TaxID=2853159 RepID=A0ABD7TN38_9PSED|nr:glycosyltransferase family 2 protein [Pseudomonas pergaminensis]USW02775.1 glycosyltransferase [Pseudomonas pergaminensis]
MKISIITVCYNSASTIRDTLESVLSQTYEDIEYIVIDGASKDSTLAIISEYEERITTVLSEPDKGIYDAMNKGVKCATGDYVGILNSDDVFSSTSTIEALVNFLQANPDCDASYANLVFVERDNTEVVTRKYSSSGFAAWKIRFGFMIPHPTFYARRSLFERFGYYKLSYRVSADFELMARFIKQGIKLARHDANMVKMRQGGISTTGFWWKVHQNMEIVRACKENGIYTNIFMVAMKIPFKIASYFFK